MSHPSTQWHNKGKVMGQRSYNGSSTALGAEMKGMHCLHVKTIIKPNNTSLLFVISTTDKSKQIIVSDKTLSPAKTFCCPNF